MTVLVPVILCGGAGTRLWPLSRELNPKQLLNLGEKDASLLQETLYRLEGLECQPPILVCNEEHRFLIAQQVQAVIGDGGRMILEPVGRNTAPAAAIACMQALRESPDAFVLILPSDHVLKDVPAFHAAVAEAITAATQERLVAFGIEPLYPETGYGYIRQGTALGQNTFEIASFIEKPTEAVAASYVAQKGYLWNSGMFLFRASQYLEELEQHRPDIYKACRVAFDGLCNNYDFLRLDGELFRACPSESIDYAVMEKTRHAAVVPLSAGWSDVGSYQALWSVACKDEAGNALSGDVVVQEVTGSYLRAESRLLTVLGLKDVVVIETKDAVLVAARDQAQQVKVLVETLRKQGRPELSLPPRVFRPWGYYECMDSGERYQVKRIGVRPGASLSLQMHHHRAEHWVVVKGTAEVTCEDRVFFVEENQSTYIPLGHKHRLSNPATGWLEIIEVQSGDYLGEDDIVRFDDHYGRV